MKKVKMGDRLVYIDVSQIECMKDVDVGCRLYFKSGSLYTFYNVKSDRIHEILFEDK